MWEGEIYGRFMSSKATQTFNDAHNAFFLPQSFTEYAQSLSELLGHLRCQEASEVAFAEG